MTALLRYHGALLLRSQRWLAPLITYAALVAVGIRPGDPVPDSLGLVSAGLVPVTAWLVRICVTVEPDAARACTAAAAGPVRVHAAALLTASTGAMLAGAAAAAVALLTGDRSGEGLGTAALAGALAVAACTLTGAAVGALCSRPLVRRRGPGIVAAALGSLLALVLAVSPARAAVSALVAAGRSGTVSLPLAALTGALLLAAAAGATACLTAARRS
ncbi:ABC transporter [Streptomyces venezuelae]|uniref:ABC transporter n=1 Tax=Streptomyces venezuelae TaxID=54571 RepID=A0A5P2DPW6_STRVZ|nr:ABC transporter [Streptomyces venezuelae]QES57245.1 ABC transporter [Streptomyces venezuelae]